MNQRETIEIKEQIEDKRFLVTRTMIEEVEGKELLEILKQIADGKANLDKQKENTDQQLKTIEIRLEEFNKHESKARLWAKEAELHNLRKSSTDNKPEENPTKPTYV